MRTSAAPCAAEVLRRFLLSVALVGAWAGAGAAFGLPAGRTCAALCFGSATVLLLLSFAAGERLLVAHFTHFDEATWFIALAHLAAVASA